MSIISFVKKNKLFSIATICFLIWIIFLVILSFIAQREVLFYNAMDLKDASSEYRSKLPLLRYILEPFIGIAFNLSNSYDWIAAYLVIFIIIRVIYLALKKKGKIKSRKYELLRYPVKDFIRFSCIVLFIAVFTAVIILAIAYLTTGIFYVNLHFMLLIQVGITVSFILIFIKAAIILMKLWHPALQFNYSVKKRYKLPDRPSTALKISRITRREFTTLVGITFLLLGTNVLLISTHFPTNIIETELADDEILFDFHVHTTMSDGWITPQERVLWYIEQGITGAAVSDHDNLRGAHIAQAFVKQNDLDFVVITAEEWTDHENNIHMNIFGLEETIVPRESNVEGGPKAMNAKDTIKYVKENGGWVTVNHYNFNYNGSGGHGTPYSLEMLRNWGADGFEIVNGGNFPYSYQRIREFCLNNSLICIAGSDMHTNGELSTLIKLRLDDPNNLTADNIFENLKRNDHDVIAINHQPHKIDLPEIFDDLELNVLEKFANYFLNLESFQILSWILWSCGAYLILVLIYRKIKKVDVNKLRVKIL